MQLIHQNQQKIIKRIFLNQKEKRSKRASRNPQRKKILKSKTEEIKESLMKPSKKKILKSKIKELKEIFHDPIIDKDEKIEKIKKNLL